MSTSESSILADHRDILSLDFKLSTCRQCDKPILDQYIMKVSDMVFHTHCLKCVDCKHLLTRKCYSKDNAMYCEQDFFKKYGTKCSMCKEGISPQSVVRKAQDHVYHVHCFKCVACQKEMKTGEEFYLLPQDGKLVCKLDYDIAKNKETDSPNKRPRTTISAKQLETLKQAYQASPKPARHVREQLAADTGLDMRVVQVWFQNRRAKEKRLKKDAGRGRWTNYFGGSGKSIKSSNADTVSNESFDMDLELSEDNQSNADYGDDAYVDIPPGYPETPGDMNDASLSCTPLDQGENLSNTGVYGSTSRLSGSTSFLSSLGPVGFSMLTDTTSSAQQQPVSETLPHSSVSAGGGLAPLAEAAAYLGEQLLHPYHNLMSTNFSQSSLRQ